MIQSNLTIASLSPNDLGPRGVNFPGSRAWFLKKDQKFGNLLQETHTPEPFPVKQAGQLEAVLRPYILRAKDLKSPKL